MSQVSRRHLDAVIEKRIYEIFVEIIRDLQTTTEVQSLLKDFFTPTERIMLPKRLCIAFLLLKSYDYRTIASYLKVSFTTVNKVSNSLKTGGKGYALVLDRLRKREEFEKQLDKVEQGIVSMLASFGGPSRVWKNLERKQRIDSHRNRKLF